MKRYALISLAIACTDGDKNPPVEFNSQPEVTITSHEDGDVVLAGEVVSFSATVSDLNDDFSDLEAQWTASGRVICAFIPPDTDGVSRCETTVQEGENVIQVEVRDPDNESGTDSVDISVVVSEAPVAQIVQPTTNGVYYSDQLITFEGVVSDEEDAAVDLIARWESSLDGVLSLNSTPDTNGSFSDVGNLSVGEHGITLYVEDTTGKNSSELITITVKESNTAPTCSITAPQTGTAGLQGELILFEAIVGDIDIPATDLTVEWSSDKDGVLGPSQPTTNGNVSFPFDALTVNTHVISLTVTDEVGEQCVDQLVYTVGSPPVLSLIRPTSGTTFNDGDVITFEAEVTDNEDVFNALTVEWSSSIDGVFESSSPNSSNLSLFGFDGLSVGAHIITITATDSDGLYSSAVLDLTINGLPSQPTVGLTPDPAYVSDDLVASASGSVDPDGQTVSYSYEWFKNSVATGLTGNTLPAANTSKGETWTVQATPSDGFSTGPYGEASIVISNTAPEVSTVSLSPSSPSTQDDITCSYVATDADGDSVTVSYVWYVNSNIQSSNTDLLSGPFQQGDVITCRVTPDDGTITGAYQEASATVTNSSPTISSVSLAPSTVYTDDYLTATVSATDPDGDPLTYQWDWYVDSGNGPQLVYSNSGLVTTDTLDGVYYFDRDDSVYVSVIVDDGSGSVSLASATIIISNTPPSATSVLISPTAPVAGLDDLYCNANDSDADGDLVTMSYVWDVDGVTTTNVSDTVLATDIANGEVWTCTVTPNDGTDDGAPQSASVTIGADVEDAVGSSFCASAGSQSDGTGYTIVSCLSDQSGVAGDESSDAAMYIWQPGSHYIFTPQ